MILQHNKICTGANLNDKYVTDCYSNCQLYLSFTPSRLSVIRKTVEKRLSHCVCCQKARSILKGFVPLCHALLKAHLIEFYPLESTYKASCL